MRVVCIDHGRPREQLAWAAGLFEGEGCFTGQFEERRVCYYPKVYLVMTDADVVERFQRVMGFGNLRWRDGQKGHKRQREWNASGFERAQYLACLLWAYLGCRRRAKIKEVLLRARQHSTKRHQRLRG